MKTIVGFLSRPHGFEVLSTLVGSPNYRLLKVYTHMLNPKSQDPNRSKRSDYDLFMTKCLTNKIELVSIDSKDQEISDFPDCDFIVEVSWRYLIPEKITSKAGIAAFGIHRGKLPEYAGAEPIKRALLKGEKEIVISSHYLVPKIDQGNTIAIMTHQVNYNSRSSFEQNIQRLREEITPLFSMLTFKTLQILSKE